MFRKSLIVAVFALVGLASISVPQDEVEAARFRRQYYSTWTYHPTANYHYCRYNYRPTVYTTTYQYHYVVRIPSRPRYRYYYNPVRRVYWGRYEVDCNGNSKGYSLLAPEDRKGSLDEIDESKFPAPAEMPAIPDSDDDIRIEPPSDLPADLDGLK